MFFVQLELLLLLMMTVGGCVAATGSNNADVWYTQLILVLQVISSHLITSVCVWW